MKSAKAVRSKNVSNPSTNPPAATSSWRPWHALVALAVASLAALWAYEPALNGPFVFDDLYLPFGAANPPNGPVEWTAGLRPLLMFSYWLNYQSSGVEPFAYHLTNVLLHVLNAALSFLIFRRLLGWQQVAERTRTVLAGLGAGIFLLHPLQTESVAYVASRSEVLSVGILMLAYVVFLYRPNVEIDWVRAAAVLVLFGAATATKEHSVVLPVLLVMTDYYFNPGWRIEGIRRNWRLYAPIAAGAVLAVALVFKVLSTATTAGFGMKDLRWYEYFFTQCRVVWSYLRLYVWPYPLNLDPDVAIARSPADPGAAAGLLALIALTAVAWIYRRRFPLSSFGILATLLMLAPTSSFAPLRDPMAEHRMYLPFFALTLVPLELLARWRPAADTVRLAAIGGALLLVLGIATYQRNFVWADPVALWQDAAAKSPGKARPHFQLAYAYFGAGRHLDATREYAKAAALDKPDARLLLDWALAADAAGLSAEAEKHLRQALQLERSAHVLATLGMVQAKQGKRAEALVSLSEAEKADGNFEMIYFYRGNVLLENGDPAAAIAQYQRTLALNPGNAPARQMLAEAQKRAGPR